MKQKKIVILTGYFAQESYGLLGPQMAATIINNNTNYEAIVLAVTNDDDKILIKKALFDFFGNEKCVVGFSCLGGRPDLFEFAKELKDQGAVTILAGPQAGPDFKGEVDWHEFPHRFKGFSDHFSFALHGPGEQIIPILNSDFKENYTKLPGVVCKSRSGKMIENKPSPWEDKFLSKIDWTTIHSFDGSKIAPVKIETAQVLQQIGCQHAAKQRDIIIDYPESLKKNKESIVTITQKGCSFCDVAADKGYIGALKEEAVKEQLKALPELLDKRKICFELINESPLKNLVRLFDYAKELNIEFSQINLTLRADYFLKGLNTLEAALKVAQKENVRILFSSVGFESFDDTILKNLNKGITKEQNLKAIEAMQVLKKRYPQHFGFTRYEGANHGFIHPTPWDSEKTKKNINTTVQIYNLAYEILPSHSTPLIIHHASGLANWIRQIETKENVQFKRHATTIGWWQIGDEFMI